MCGVNGSLSFGYFKDGSKRDVREVAIVSYVSKIMLGWALLSPLNIIRTQKICVCHDQIMVVWTLLTLLFLRV